MDEYNKMFQLENDVSKRIADFGGGPSSFNAEMAEKGGRVISFDPIYRFQRSEIEKRIEEVRAIVMRQMAENKDNYVWRDIRNPDELENIRMSAMKRFLVDYETGRKEGRYVFHELPERLPYGEDYFDIGLSSHFLLMYTALGYDFHIAAITEMLRVCKEVRIFPVVDLDAQNTKLTEAVIQYFKGRYKASIVETEYEFQKGGNKLLVIAA